MILSRKGWRKLSGFKELSSCQQEGLGARDDPTTSDPWPFIIPLAKFLTCFSQPHFTAGVMQQREDTAIDIDQKQLII